MGCGYSALANVQLGTKYTPQKVKNDLLIINEMVNALPRGGLLGHDSYCFTPEQEALRKDLTDRIVNASDIIGKKPYITLDQEMMFEGLDRIRYENARDKTNMLMHVTGTDASKWVDHQLWKAGDRYNVYKSAFMTSV